MKYVGHGRFVVGIPATDLDADQLAALAKQRGVTPEKLRKDLIASGLYAEPKAKKE